MSQEEEIVIDIRHLSKVYKIFDRPSDRVKEALSPFHKRYSRDFYALQDINLSIWRGETVGIIGKNGAGKSTLLKVITGVLAPSGGELHVHGSIASLLELGAGFNPEMSGVENIYMNGTIMGRSRAEMDELYPAIAEFADIGEFIHQPVKMYSSGMFARLAFAANVFIEPKILIVDEALSVGDSKFQIKCMRKMKQLMEGGTAVLFVSHDMNVIRRFCTRVIWLEHGRLMEQGDTNWVVDRYMDHIKEKNSEEAVQEKKSGPRVVAKSEDAAITSFRVLDLDGHEVETAGFDQPLRIEVGYEVNNTKIAHPVLGVSIRTIDDEYICGLNTLLDHKKIPWERGENHAELVYPEGLRVLGGRYAFDVALFDETATVPLQLICRKKELVVVAEYVGEGMMIIPHAWQLPDEAGKNGGEMVGKV